MNLVENMNKLMILISALIVIAGLIAGCVSVQKTLTFEQGTKRISEIDKGFGSDLKKVPNSTEDINNLVAQLTGFAAVNSDMPESLDALIDFRIKSLEAELLHIEGWQWGKASTTDYGFGCKGTGMILNSSRIRNASAQKGYEAVSTLQLFIDKFPEEAKSLNLTQKDVIFLNAAYYEVEKKAGRDAAIITSLCKDKVNITN
jgi:hypothetical protein